MIVQDLVSEYRHCYLVHDLAIVSPPTCSIENLFLQFPGNHVAQRWNASLEHLEEIELSSGKEVVEYVHVCFL